MWLKFTLVLGICPMAVFLDKALLWGWVILCLLFYVGAGLLALYLVGLLLMLLFSSLAYFVLKDVCRVVIPFDDVQHASTLLG